MEIRFFDQETEEFIEKLDAPTGTKVARTLDLLEKFGSGLKMPHSKKISGNLFELRVHGKREIRLFYCFKNGAVILLCFIKKSQEIPKRIIKLAEKRLKSIDNL